MILNNLHNRLLAIGSKRLLVGAMEGNIKLITELVEDGNISVNTEFFSNGYTALHQSCDNNNPETVKVLINFGADVNKKVRMSCGCHVIFHWCVQGGVFSQTPLHIASSLNSIDIAKILIDNGAKLDIKDSEGKVRNEIL